jgi:hypothetical protein
VRSDLSYASYGMVYVVLTPVVIVAVVLEDVVPEDV